MGLKFKGPPINYVKAKRQSIIGIDANAVLRKRLHTTMNIVLVNMDVESGMNGGTCGATGGAQEWKTEEAGYTHPCTVGSLMSLQPKHRHR